MKNARNRKTATQNGQTKKPHQILVGKRKPQATIETAKPHKNRMKNRQKPQNRTIKSTKTAKPHEKIDENRKTARKN